jgi:hypothetical protein
MQSEKPMNAPNYRLSITPDSNAPAQTILAGLNIWLELNLIAEVDLRFLIPPQPDDRLQITINAAAAETELLKGLEAWLNMGLISDRQINQFCQTQLICLTPEFSGEFGVSVANFRQQTAEAAQRSLIPTPETSATGAVFPTSQPIPYVARSIDAADATEETTSRSTLTSQAAQPTRPQAIDRIARLVRSLFAEFSLIWLLFLGVFLVVLSSAVLAASQWNQFPPQVQYAILFAYTLGFWGVSEWTGRQENLRLTTRTLQILTLLVMPVNFWTIDGFKLLSDPIGLIESAIATLILAGVTLILLRKLAAARLTALNCIVLSLLHFGWGINGYPLVAVYIGTITTALIVLWRQRREQAGQPRMRLSLGEVAIAYTTLILLVRATFVAGVVITDLGLAVGICGWIAGKLSLRGNRGDQSTQRPEFPIAELLFLVGWGVCVDEAFPWQAVAVSILALLFLYERLQQIWRRVDLTAIFLVQLQTIWLAYQLLPAEIRTDLANWGMNWADTNTVIPLVGVVYFPYVVLSLFAANWLRRSQQRSLAHLSELLALGLGVALTCVSLLSPTKRSLNLVLSTITLFMVTLRRERVVNDLIYGTHLVGVAAIASCADLFIPDLEVTDWAILSLTITLVEWAISAFLPQILSRLRLPIPPSDQNDQNSEAILIWRKSGWYLGLALAGLSYFLLLLSSIEELSITSIERLVWLAVPIALTLLGYVRGFRAVYLPALPESSGTIAPPAWTVHDFSIGAILTAQLLTLPDLESRSIALGVGTVLMLVNMLRSPGLPTAHITIGFGLSFVAALLWQFSIDWQGEDRFYLFINSAAIAVVILLAIRYWLKRINADRPLFGIYRRALSNWAIVLTVGNLLILSLIALIVFTFASTFLSGFTTAAMIITATMVYCTITEAKAWSHFFLGWGIELLIFAVVNRMGGSWQELAIANIGLGFATQLGGDFWQARRREVNLPIALQVLPLAYGILGTIFRLGIFADWTGCITLGTALITIGIGRRQREWSGLTYVGIAGITVGVYEFIFYQLLQQSGDNLGDAIVLLAIAAITIAIIYRALTLFLAAYLRLEAKQIKIIANCHWFIGTTLLVAAMLEPLSQKGGLVGAGVAIALSAYAIYSGRDRHNPEKLEFWVYAGVATAFQVILFFVLFAFPNAQFFEEVLFPYGGAIAAIVSIPLYLAPWRSWGWSQVPWQRCAIVIPALVAIVTGLFVAIPNLFITAAFYSWLAKKSNTIRLSYIGLACVNWALLLFYQEHNLTNSLWYACAWGFSLLYIVQVDPGLQSPDARLQRHLLRCLGTASICATAGLQSFDDNLMAWISIAISLAFVFAGLSLRVRAYLYVGTLAFMGTVLIQVTNYVTKYSFMIWALGILAGIVFIWIAANFESRRDRTLSMLQERINQLEFWE